MKGAACVNTDDTISPLQLYSFSSFSLVNCFSTKVFILIKYSSKLVMYGAACVNTDDTISPIQ